MLIFNKIENVIIIILSFIIVVLIDLVIRNREIIDICYLIFMICAFIRFMFLKNKN